MDILNLFVLVQATLAVIIFNMSVRRLYGQIIATLVLLALVGFHFVRQSHAVQIDSSAEFLWLIALTLIPMAAVFSRSFIEDGTVRVVGIQQFLCRIFFYHWCLQNRTQLTSIYGVDLIDIIFGVAAILLLISYLTDWNRRYVLAHVFVSFFIYRFALGVNDDALLLACLALVGLGHALLPQSSKSGSNIYFRIAGVGGVFGAGLLSIFLLFYFNEPKLPMWEIAAWFGFFVVQALLLINSASAIPNTLQKLKERWIFVLIELGALAGLAHLLSLKEVIHG